MKTPHLSVVIPAFNEEAIIEENLRIVKRYLSGKKYSSEVIVVDDGSTDATSELVGKLKGIKLIKLKTNTGKGGALRRGMTEAKGELVIFMDADLSVPLEHIDDLVTVLDKNDVAIGSRRVKGARIKKHQPFLRENMGRVFTKLTQLFMGSNIADFTCGFKGFRREAAMRIFGKSKITRWAYDAEIIFLAKKFGFGVTQVPVVWINREETRVRVGRASIESLADLVRIRIFDILGKYES